MRPWRIPSTKGAVIRRVHDYNALTWGLPRKNAVLALKTIRTLGYGNTRRESKYDPDEVEDGRNDSAWVADCLRIWALWVASVNDYHGRRQWITPGQREKDERGEVGFTG